MEIDKNGKVISKIAQVSTINSGKIVGVTKMFYPNF